jgi:hypothetical protein
MRRMAAEAILTGALWMGLAVQAQAQVQIMPTGPLALKESQNLLLPSADASVAGFSECSSNIDKFYPGRTMGGGSRMLRPNPPPSFFMRRKE